MRIHDIALRILSLLIVCTLITPAVLADNPAKTTVPASEEKQARDIFDKAFDKLFGPEGCSLDYNLNVIGLFKNKGSIWKKGMKIKYIDDKHEGWMRYKIIDHRGETN